MGNKLSRQQRRAEERMGSKPKPWMAIALWSLLGLGVIGLGWWMAQPTDSNEATVLATDADLDLCVTHGGLSLHIHPHLRIIVDGTERPIPANVGVTDSCLKPLHMHDGSGIIHIESPRKRDFTIGQFFKIWDNPYTDTKFMDVDLGADRQIKVFADKEEITSGAGTIMKDHVSYVLMVGKTGETLTPPENYSFSE
jgi:hypothetical protein